MTVNHNVRCVEWFDVRYTTPTIGYFVLGWYEDGHIRRCRLMDGEWYLDSYGPGSLRHEFAKPTHWCELPDGPHELPCYCEVDSKSTECPIHGHTAGWICRKCRQWNFDSDAVCVREGCFTSKTAVKHE